MVGSSVRRLSVVLATILAGLAVGSCASSTHSVGSGMMGGANASVPGSTGSGMMGGGSDYHYSRLTCSAPGSLPGRTVSVTLADMGMTQMMSGVAPLGVHMMLRVTPTT